MKTKFNKSKYNIRTDLCDVYYNDNYDELQGMLQRLIDRLNNDEYFNFATKLGKYIIYKNSDIVYIVEKGKINNFINIKNLK